MSTPLLASLSAALPASAVPPSASTTAELKRLILSLTHATALLELAVLAACLSLAFGLTRGLRARLGAGRLPVWLGERGWDGVLFPVLALVLALVARPALALWMPIAVFRLAVPVLVSLVVIRVSVRVLRVAFPQSTLVGVVERSISWVAWAGMVLWVTGLLPLLMQELDQIGWKIGSARVSLRNLIEGVLSAVVVMVVALWVSSAIEGRLLKGATHNLSLRKIAANATRALLLLVGLLLALSAAGIDLTVLSVFGGAIGVGLGFGLQKLASNYVSGFVILAERSLRIGDLVKVDNFEGRIVDINTRFTVIRNGNGREALVPNEVLITQRVENASRVDPTLQLTSVFQIAYGSDFALLRERLAAALARVPRVMATPAPTIELSNFTPDGLEVTVQFWVGDPGNGQSNVRSAVNETVLAVLAETGVEMACPRRLVQGLPLGAGPRYDGTPQDLARAA
ncbi:mechanosensitive ion channel [Aquabacterium sp. A7-Y]|uniref:mechanosensitive ion channel family protein n=1 Tax=Aquabacterium sp. A7-Y TaxID=1349605 RepID=UPI00223E7D89|nr:mechanosensitive ion channel domain-containing protein [Aquabacterium sp. A7-Y]MCW7538178.1 mechanosensitive ion channel [Aquabacterium sp. A7-Y]